jgi:hypothetical protein
MKRKYTTKVASVHVITNDHITLLWLNTLYNVSMRTARKVLRKSRSYTYIVWTLDLGFRFY